MSRVARLAGALLAETGGDFYLVGNTKEPCDFAAAGFEPPVEPIDALRRPHVRLAVAGRVELASPWLALGLEGEALAPLLAERLLIGRNCSVSERLWRLVACLEEDGASGPKPGASIDARWLAEIPTAVWQLVRDSVLRCT